ncbi:MAG: hypothetical protein NZ959_00815, partial [Armatimonadetes bacterium]|nr:hypothetical protein [Armatimonadota bacterium]
TTVIDGPSGAVRISSGAKILSARKSSRSLSLRLFSFDGTVSQTLLVGPQPRTILIREVRGKEGERAQWQRVLGTRLSDPPALVLSIPHKTKEVEVRLDY